MTAGRKTPLFDFLHLFVRFVTVLGAAVGAITMAVLFASGLLKSSIGAYHVLSSTFSPAEQESYAGHVTKIIHGVELLLLAPVPFLILKSLNRYLPEGMTGAAHDEVIRVKGFLTGLLFALVATTAAGQALEGTLTLASAAATGVVMTILGLFFVGLEWIGLARKADCDSLPKAEQGRMNHG